MKAGSRVDPHSLLDAAMPEGTYRRMSFEMRAEFASAVLGLRLDAQISQNELAKRAGLDVGSVSAIESVTPDLTQQHLENAGLYIHALLKEDTLVAISRNDNNAISSFNIAMRGLRSEAGLTHEDVARSTALTVKRIVEIEQDSQHNEGYLADSGLFIQACRQNWHIRTSTPE
jgi:transcriptional regulator with XRE-family HTH domain